MKSKIILIIAMIMGLITSLLIYNYLNDVKSSYDTVDYIEIVTAAVDIEPNTVVDRNMVELKKVPMSYKHPQVVTAMKDVVGKIALIPFIRGEDILHQQIIDAGDHREGLAYKVPIGKRAIAIPIDEVSGVAKMLRVGDRVDIISTISVGEDPPITYTLVVLQDVEVLGIGRTIDQNRENVEATTITLAVTLEDALPLKHASARGNISFMLRSPVDDGRSDPKPFQVDDFLGDR